MKKIILLLLTIVLYFTANSQGLFGNKDYSENLIINTSLLSQGVYFLEVKNDTEIYREKLIIN